MKNLPTPTFIGAIKNIASGIYTRTAKFAGYASASPGPTRPVGNRLGTNTNSTFAQMQRVGMNFTAEMVTKDNPLASAYLAQRQNYCSSQMIYIPSTPDAGLNKEITQYLHGYDGFGGLFSRMGVDCSMQDAFMRTADLETPVRGDAGLIWWRENDNSDLRLIEFSADQLGEIYNFGVSRSCSLSRNSNGELCEVGGKDCLYYQGRYFRGADCVAYKIYERTESWYGHGRIYSASDVLYFRDPANYRGIRGVTAFANSISHMQKSEDLLQAALSAAQRQARTYGRVFNEAGESDEPSYETSLTGQITFFEKIPGAPVEEFYYNGDSAEFSAPTTPSAEVIQGIQTAQELACLGLRMPFAFLVNPNAVGGAPSRLEVEKADKEFQRIQNTIHRPHLRVIADVVLLDAMQRGNIIPPRGMTGAQFKQGRWMLPVSPSVDAFYDCKENIDMMRAGLEAPQDIIAETNRNADDVLRKTKEWAMKVQMMRQDANKELIAAGYKGEVTAMDIAQVTDNPPQQPAASGEQSQAAMSIARMAEKDVEWITVNGAHFPIKDGQSVSEAIKGREHGDARDGSKKPVDEMSPSEQKSHSLKVKHEKLKAKNADLAKKLASINEEKARSLDAFNTELKRKLGSNDELKARVQEMTDKLRATELKTKTIAHALQGEDVASDENGHDSPEHNAARKRTEYVGRMAEWDEAKHKRGQPGNAGEFGPGGGTATIEKPKTQEKEESNQGLALSEKSKNTFRKEWGLDESELSDLEKNGRNSQPWKDYIDQDIIDRKLPEVEELLKIHPRAKNVGKDAKFMDAVESGDMASAENLIHDEAKKAGFQGPFYHGTSKEFDEIDPSKFGSATHGPGSKSALWLTEDKTHALERGPIVKPFYIKAGRIKTVKELIDTFDAGKIVDEAKTSGNYDAVHFEKLDDADGDSSGRSSFAVIGGSVVSGDPSYAKPPSKRFQAA